MEQEANDHYPPDVKSVIDRLDFDKRTARRVAYSQWEFTIVAPYTVEVTNASYGHLKDQHAYEVRLEVEATPVSCTCPGFKHHYSPEGKTGKHMLALATVGGPTVLEAAVNFENAAPDKLKADGGTVNQREGGECDCATLSDDFPCWPCVRGGKRELPE